MPHTPPLPACRRQACGGFEPSSGRGFSHDAVTATATGIQIRLRISRISSFSLKQLRVGHVFFRFATSGIQELVEAEEFAAQGGWRIPNRLRRLRVACPLRFCFVQRVGNSLLRFDQPPTMRLWRPALAA